MINEKLKVLQPIIHQVLSQSFEHQTIPHSFLLKGNNKELKKATAIFLAQSIVEGHLACETCNTCRRIAELQYTDLIYLDGEFDMVKKDAVEDLQAHFSLMANEIAQKKVYIINCIENTSTASLNSLLKFLEEPYGEDTFAILITDSVDKVLDTIVSRCMVLDFKYQDPLVVMSEYQANGCNMLESYYLAKVLNAYDFQAMENEGIQSAFYFFKQFIKAYPNHLDDFLYELHSELLLYKDKEIELASLKWLINFLIVFFKEVVMPFNLEEDWYNREVERIQNLNHTCDLVLLKLLNTQACLNKTYDYRLMMDRLICQLKVR